MAGVFEILGQGGFGVVRRVVRNDMVEVARKQFDPLRVQAFNEEVYWLKKVHHAGVCEFIIKSLVCYLFKFIIIFLFFFDFINL